MIERPDEITDFEWAILRMHVQMGLDPMEELEKMRALDPTSPALDYYPQSLDNAVDMMVGTLDEPEKTMVQSMVAFARISPVYVPAMRGDTDAQARLIGLMETIVECMAKMQEMEAEADAGLGEDLVRAVEATLQRARDSRRSTRNFLDQHMNDPEG